MGGYYSGRSRTRNRGSMEAALRLDMRALRRRGLLREGCIISSPWRWTWNDGETAGTIEVMVDFSVSADRIIVLTYAAGGEARRERVRVEALPMRFGGFRYYFRCPVSGVRCEVLACAGGRFMSRRGARLSYASQSADAWSRLLSTKSRLEALLWPDTARAPRLRGARRQRIFERWARLEEVADQQLRHMVEKLQVRYERAGGLGSVLD